MSSFYLIQSDGYFYCSRRSELLTSPHSHVSRGDDLSFKFGSKTMKGKVLFESDKEKDVLDEIQRLKNEKKTMKRESSFDGSKKRRAAVKADQALSSGSSSRKTSDSKKKDTSQPSLKKKTVRDKAVEATETLLNVGKVEKEDFGDTTDEDKDTNSSVASSLEMLSSEQLSKCNLQDAQSIKKMERESDSSISETDSTKKITSDRSDNDSSGLPVQRSFRVSSSESEDDPMKLSDRPLKHIKVEESSEATLKENILNENIQSEKEEKSMKPDKEERGDDGKDSKKRKKGENGDDGKDHKKSRKSDKKEKRDDGKDSKNSKSKTEEKENSSKKHNDKEKKKTKSEKKTSESETESKQVKEEKHSKKSKVKKEKRSQKKKSGRRNETVYDGVNYKYDKNSPGVTQLNSKYQVYVLQSDYDTISSAQTAKAFVTKMIEKVYTREALKAATPRGFPPRGKGRQTYKDSASSPMLHPDGLAAIIAQAITLQETTKGWRPKRSEAELQGSSRVKCSTLKRKYMDEDESPSDSSSSTNSSSDDE